MDTGILLESGTNELEILEFKIANNYYGINVAKIKEILSYKRPTPVPNAHPYIEGIFMPRDIIISVVDLAKCLNLPKSDNENSDMNIITNFNKMTVAFHVQQVIGIHRITWEEIIKPDETISSGGQGLATGIVKLEDRLIIVLDFEKIISDISPETGLKVSDINRLGTRNRNDAQILIAEDSALLNNLICECLTKAGYANIITTKDGLDAWNKLQEFKNGQKIADIKCVITDIEMPQMDGHHLTKLIKTDAELKALPVVIFSSLINDEMRRKGELLGADAQLTKPEIGKLVEAIDKLILIK